MRPEPWFPSQQIVPFFILLTINFWMDSTFCLIWWSELPLSVWKYSQTYNGRNVVSTLAPSIFYSFNHKLLDGFDILPNSVE